MKVRLIRNIARWFDSTISLKAGFTEQDEETVTRLSSVLYQVLKQNPHIFTFQS